MEEFLGRQDFHTNLKEACIRDYYIQLIHFAKQNDFTEIEVSISKGNFFRLLTLVLKASAALTLCKHLLQNVFGHKQTIILYSPSSPIFSFAILTKI